MTEQEESKSSRDSKGELKKSSNLESKKEQQRVLWILLLVFFIAALSFFLPKAFVKKEKQKVQILKNGKVLIEKNLSENSKILIIDTEAREVDFTENLASLSEEEQNPAMHEVNFIEIKEAKVVCTQSNCNNQICVHTPAISQDNPDLPIVCLPHGLMIQIITKS